MDHKPTSAVKVLTSDRNRDLKVYPGSREGFYQKESAQTDGSGRDVKRTRKRGYFLFEDLVKQHQNNLEQIIDYQRHTATQDEVKMKMRVRKHLEGWDSVELATDHDPYARVATLQAMGYGWVHFVCGSSALSFSLGATLARLFGRLSEAARCASTGRASHHTGTTSPSAWLTSARSWRNMATLRRVRPGLSTCSSGTALKASSRNAPARARRKEKRRMQR